MTEFFRRIGGSGKSRGRKVIRALSMIIVFIMVYSQISPALAVEKSKAEAEPGMYLAEDTSGEVDQEEPDNPESIQAESEQLPAERIDEPENEPADQTDTRTVSAAPVQSAGQSADTAQDTAGQTAGTANAKPESNDASGKKPKGSRPADEDDVDVEQNTYADHLEGVDAKTGIRVSLTFDRKDLIESDASLVVHEIPAQLKKDAQGNAPENKNYQALLACTQKAVSARELKSEPEAGMHSNDEILHAAYLSLSVVDGEGRAILLPAHTTIHAEIACPVAAIPAAVDSSSDAEQSMNTHRLSDSASSSASETAADGRAEFSAESVSDSALAPDLDGHAGFYVLQTDTHTTFDEQAEDPDARLMPYAKSGKLHAEFIEDAEDQKDETRDEMLFTMDLEKLDDLGFVEVSDEISDQGDESLHEEEADQFDSDEEQMDVNWGSSTLKALEDGCEITVLYDESAQLPENTTLSVKKIDENSREYGRLVDRCPQRNQNEEIVLFDITLLDEEGNEIEPAAPVQVSIRMPELTEVEPEDVTLVHFTGSAQEVEGELEDDTLSFEAESFSVYGVIYTVDFHWEVNGKVYEFSIPGGGFVSLTQLVEVLGIAKANEEGESEQSDEPQEIVDGESVTTLGELTVSEETRKFVESVEKVEFSSPELLWVGKTDTDTTVGQIKEEQGLQCEYSTTLSEEKINEINGTEVPAGDWALISLKAFDTDEYLTVRMLSGEEFIIRVTDAQTPVNLDTSGLTGKITVDLFDYYGNNSDHSKDNLDSSTNHLTGESSSTGAVNNGINSGHDLKFMAYGYDGGNSINHFTGGTTIRQGIVQNTLIGGYPKLATGSQESLDYLFTQKNGTGKLYKGGVEGLFYKANSDGSYNANGSYYAYDSDRYYAYYKNDGTIEHHVADIKIETTSGGGGSTTNDGTAGKPIGFFPLDAYNSSKTCPHPRDINWWHNSTSNNGYYNHGFGLSMSGDFQVPKGGKVNGQDMIFSFSGDDDMWVFVDDVLVLDIGGIHHPSSGTINFTAGTVTVDNAVTGVSGNNNTINLNNGSKVTANIADLFTAAGKTWNSGDYSSHTIKVFYLERGGIYSNCKITFNIPLTLGEGKATIVKKDADTGNTVSNGFLAGAKFGLWDNAECSGDPFAVQISGSDGQITFSGLPVDTVNRKYYLKEIEAPANYQLSSEIYTLSVGTKGSDNLYSFTITDSSGKALQTIGQSPAIPVVTNSAVTTEATAVKAWANADGTDTAPTGASVTFELYADDVATGKKVVLNGKPDVKENPSEGQELISTAGNSENAYESAAWIAKWTDLRKYQNDSTTEIVYTIKEVSSPDGYAADYGKAGNNPKTAAGNGEIITNRQSSIDITILKKDAANESILLGGAEFKLTKVRGIDSTQKVIEEKNEWTGTTSNDASTKGQLKFEGLTSGYYYLEEINPPDGYLKTDSGWHFQVDANGIVKASGDFNANGKFRYTAASAITVTNEPGASLPSTGGSGTAWIYILGMACIAFAATGLVMSRRRK